MYSHHELSNEYWAQCDVQSGFHSKKIEMGGVYGKDVMVKGDEGGCGVL